MSEQTQQLPILVICPTRERGDWVYRVLRSWEEASEGKSDIIFVTDDDDPTERPSCHIKLPRMTLSAKINAGVEKMPRHDFYMFIGDDVVFKQKWESEMIASCSRYPVGIAWAFDGFQTQNLPVHMMVSRTWYDVLGWMVYPEVKHYFVDNITIDIARYAGYEAGVGDGLWCFRRDILIEHLHPDAGKAPKNDGTYKASQSWWGHDENIYRNKFLTGDMWTHIRKLADYVKRNR